MVHGPAGLICSLSLFLSLDTKFFNLPLHKISILEAKKGNSSSFVCDYNKKVTLVNVGDVAFYSAFL